MDAFGIFCLNESCLNISIVSYKFKNLLHFSKSPNNRESFRWMAKERLKLLIEEHQIMIEYEPPLVSHP